MGSVLHGWKVLSENYHNVHVNTLIDTQSCARKCACMQLLATYYPNMLLWQWKLCNAVAMYLCGFTTIYTCMYNLANLQYS